MSYTFKPYRGYHVQDVVVDGKSMGHGSLTVYL